MTGDHDRVGDLRGVRFGALERTILMAAPPLGNVGGLLIEAPEGTDAAQQGYLRAAKKLERCELVHRARIRRMTKARDPRRQEPFYEGGAFWMRPDATRVHHVYRVFVWATPFGEGIRMVYADELTRGRPIRWSSEKITNARRYANARWVDPDVQAAAETMLEQRLCEQQPEPGPARRYREAYPDTVENPTDAERWRLAVRSARRAQPGRGSGALWAAASELYDSPTSTAELAASAGRQPQPPGSDPLRFHRSELGQVIATNPRVRRKQLDGSANR